MKPSNLSCQSTLLPPPLFQMLEARLYSLQEVAVCQQACYSYDGALQTLTQIREEAEGKPCEWVGGGWMEGEGRGEGGRWVDGR